MPIPTSPYPVPVVRIILPDDRGHVLIVRRAADSFCGGSWCLPGGKVDYGGTVAETIRKELLEETSLEVSGYRFLFFQDSPPAKPGAMQCLNLYFECDAAGALRLNRESSEYRWVSLEEADDYDIVFGNREALGDYWRSRQVQA